MKLPASGHLRRFSHVRRQNLARELAPLAIDNPLVVDPRRVYLDFADAGGDRPRFRSAIAHNEAVSVVVALAQKTSSMYSFASVSITVASIRSAAQRTAPQHRVQVIFQAALVRLLRPIDAISNPQLLVIPPKNPRVC